MPTLETPAGKPLDVTPADAGQVNAEFRAAMDDYLPDEQAPPKRAARPPAEQAKPRARTQRAEKSRTADKAASAVKDDYAKDAQDFVGMTWTVAASIPYTQPYALVIESNSDALAGALAEGAKHNATIRSFIASGESSWMLALAGVSLNMGMQMWQIARDPALKEQARAVTVEHLKAAIGARGVEVPEPSREPADA